LTCLHMGEYNNLTCTCQCKLPKMKILWFL
jgi:hypothetical protein